MHRAGLGPYALVCVHTFVSSVGGECASLHRKIMLVSISEGRVCGISAVSDLGISLMKAPPMFGNSLFSDWFFMVEFFPLPFPTSL